MNTNGPNAVQQGLDGIGALRAHQMPGLPESQIHSVSAGIKHPHSCRFWRRQQLAPSERLEGAVHQRLIDIARNAGEHRDERLTKSLTQIPATLIHLVHTMEIGLLLLVFFYPFHHWVAGMCSFLLVAVILFLANLVMTDTDNPFKGVYNVGPKAFSDLRA